jgi:hypothetical protein
VSNEGFVPKVYKELSNEKKKGKLKNELQIEQTILQRHTHAKQAHKRG